MDNATKIEKAKQDSIRTAILYRSLYILDYKFKKYKKEINAIYDNYYAGPPTRDFQHRIIQISNFFPLVLDVFKVMKITIPRILNPSDIFYFDKANFDQNDKSHQESILLMEKILKDRKNLDKYNNIYYKKKIKPLIDEFLESKNNPDVTNWYKIVEYDRKGRIIHDCNELFALNGTKGGYKGVRKNPQEDYDFYMKKGNIYFIETLPILIADFLQNNQEFVVINLDLDDKILTEALKKLFDDDILKKIREKKKPEPVIVNTEEELTDDEKLLRKLLERKKKLEKRLQTYESILYNKKKTGDNNVKYIQDYIKKLKEELEKLNNEILALQNKINGVNSQENSEIESENKEDSKQENEKIIIDESELNMRKIFAFYCNQHRANGSFPTFDEINFKTTHMNISEFCKFCKDFNVPIDRDKLMEFFKKKYQDKENNEIPEIDYKEFHNALKKIGNHLIEVQKNDIKKKIEKLKLVREGGGTSLYVEEDIEKLENEIEILNRLPAKVKFKKFQKFLEIDQPKKYIEKMKGFLKKEEMELFVPYTKEEIDKIHEKLEKVQAAVTDKKNKMQKKINENKKENFLAKKDKFDEDNKKLTENYNARNESKTYGNISKKILNLSQFLINEKKIKKINFKDLNLNKNEKQIFENMRDNVESDDEDFLDIFKVNNDKLKQKKILRKKSSKKIIQTEINEDMTKPIIISDIDKIISSNHQIKLANDVISNKSYKKNIYLNTKTDFCSKNDDKNIITITNTDINSISSINSSNNYINKNDEKTNPITLSLITEKTNTKSKKRNTSAKSVEKQTTNNSRNFKNSFISDTNKSKLKNILSNSLNEKTELNKENLFRKQNKNIILTENNINQNNITQENQEQNNFKTPLRQIKNRKFNVVLSETNNNKIISNSINLLRSNVNDSLDKTHERSSKSIKVKSNQNLIKDPKKIFPLFKSYDFENEKEKSILKTSNRSVLPIIIHNKNINQQNENYEIKNKVTFDSKSVLNLPKIIIQQNLNKENKNDRYLLFQKNPNKIIDNDNNENKDNSDNKEQQNKEKKSNIKKSINKFKNGKSILENKINNKSMDLSGSRKIKEKLK